MTALERLYVAQSVDLAATAAGVTRPVAIAAVLDGARLHLGRMGRARCVGRDGQSLDNIFKRIGRKQNVSRPG